MHSAAEGGHPETIQILVSHGAIVDPKDKVVHICKISCIRLQWYLLPIQYEQTPLHLAADEGHTKAFEELLLWVDLSSIDIKDEVSILYYCAQWKYNTLIM